MSAQDDAEKFITDGDSRRPAHWGERVKGFFGMLPTGGRVTVLGTSAVGKSTLWHSMQGRLPRDAEPTAMRREKAPPRVLVDAGDRQVLVPLRPDVGGTDEARDAFWREEFLRADVVIYILDLPLFMRQSRTRDFSVDGWIQKANTLREDVQGHLIDMAYWQENRPKPWLRKKPIPKLIVIGSWCDDHPAGSGGGAEETIRRDLESDRLYEQVRNRLVKNELVPQLLVGSLATQDSRKRLIEKVVACMFS